MDVAFSIKSTEKYWNKVILISNLENELEKAVSLGATPATQKEDLFSFASYFMAKENSQQLMTKVASLKKPVALRMGC